MKPITMVLPKRIWAPFSHARNYLTAVGHNNQPELVEDITYEKNSNVRSTSWFADERGLCSTCSQYGTDNHHEKAECGGHGAHRRNGNGYDGSHCGRT